MTLSLRYFVTSSLRYSHIAVLPFCRPAPKGDLVSPERYQDWIGVRGR